MPFEKKIKISIHLKAVLLAFPELIDQYWFSKGIFRLYILAYEELISKLTFVNVLLEVFIFFIINTQNDECLYSGVSVPDRDDHTKMECPIQERL